MADTFDHLANLRHQSMRRDRMSGFGRMKHPDEIQGRRDRDGGLNLPWERLDSMENKGNGGEIGTRGKSMTERGEVRRDNGTTEPLSTKWVSELKRHRDLSLFSKPSTSILSPISSNYSRWISTPVSILLPLPWQQEISLALFVWILIGFITFFVTRTSICCVNTAGTLYWKYRWSRIF